MTGVTESGRPGDGRGLRIHLLGGLRLEPLSGDPIAVPAGRARGLFAYLVLHPAVPHARERLVDALWPDLPPERAGRQLADAAYRLRQALPSGLLVVDRSALRFQRPAGIWVDAWAFEELMARGSPDEIRKAVELYAGELLPEIYDDWIAARRAALADAYRSGLAELAREAERAGTLVDAFGYYHRLTAADPLDEAGHRGLMRAYLRAGHAGAAIQQYERLATLIRSELEIEPSPESRAIVEEARRRIEDAGPTAARPFVGRRHERAAILERIDRASSAGPELVLIEGDAGIGKSRLLEVLAGDAAWRGFQVAAARVTEAAVDSPYAPLDSALRSVLTAPTMDRLRRSLTPGAFDAVASLLPQLVDRPSAASSRVERPNLAHGLVALFEELTRTRRWLLLLDDVHLAGAAFWDAMTFIDELRPLPIAVVLAARGHELRERAQSWEAVRGLDRRLAPLRLRLEGLRPGESRELAEALGRTLADAELADLQRISAGNPLVLQQALTAAGETTRGQPGFVELLEGRLAALGPAGRRAVEAAAVLGSGFSLAEWLALLPELPMDAVEDVLAARLVVELSDGYALEHDLTREHIYASIDDDRRRALHRRAAAALPREHTAPAVLAKHHERGGELARAVAEHRRAAEEALARYAYPEALEHADRALALGPGGADRSPLLSLRHRILGRQLRLADWRLALDEAERLALETGDQLALIEVLEGRLSLHTLDGDLEAMEAAGARAVALAVELRDEATEARVLATLGWHVSESQGDNRRALPMLRRAVRLAAAAEDEPTRVAALCMTSSALRSIGRCKAAHVSASRAMTLVSTRPQLYRGRAHALAELAETALELGRWAEAREAMRAGLEGFREVDDPWSYGSALFGLVNICSGMGQAAEALAAARELVALSRRLGLAATSDYGTWHLVCLARACLAAGDTDGAEAAIEEVREAVPGAVRPRIALAGVRGQVALARGRPETAADAFEGAFELWLERGEARDAAIALWLAITATRAGRAAIANRALEAGAAALAATDTERHDVLLHFARFEATASPAALRAADAALARQAARIRDPALRAAFEQDVPLHRELRRRATVATAGGVRLARADVPLGRPIRDGEWVEVTWSVEGDDAYEPATTPAERRRRRLVALVEQARTAGASPTDEQLAGALGVSRRTVIRDIQILRARDEQVVTRRRRS